MLFDLITRALGNRYVRIAGIVVLAITILSLAKCSYDRSVIASYKARQEARTAPAQAKAAESRAADTIANAASEKGLHDVIEAAPTGGTISPAAHALACERLRRAGRSPASCRAASGN